MMLRELTRLTRAERVLAASAWAAAVGLPADPVALARRVGIVPDPWQRDVLTSPALRLLLNCCRQSGKSTTTALLALYTALGEAGALILLVSSSQRQSAELFRQVAGFYHQLGEAIPSEAESVLRLELANGSRILALPGTERTIRGMAAPRLVIIDEASRVDDALYHAITPMLAVSGGRLLALSTPWGQRGWWHQAWTEGQGWERVEIPADQCPRISAEFLAAERLALPDWVYAQEYLCQFRGTEDQLWSHELVAAALCGDVAPLFAPAPIPAGLLVDA